MKGRIKLGVTVLILLIAVAMFSRFLDWMNLPSDVWFWSGVIASVLLLVVVPSLIATIWRVQQRH
jgi:phosphoglycerol transferase MdoB-like AlkP superfamily enzyme